MAQETSFRLVALVLLAVLTNRATVPVKKGAATRSSHARASADYGSLPLAFEPNIGQTDARVRFLARGPGLTAFFTDTETDMVLSRMQSKKPDRPGPRKAAVGEVEQTLVRMKLVDASHPRQIIGVEKQPGISNYFIGNDPAKWRTDVPHYGRIQYQGVYPGIDLVWYGSQRQFEYDFVVDPGADPTRIQVAYEGVESLSVEANGDLVLRTAVGEVRQQKPKVYQEIAGKRVEVAAQYSIVARNRVSFALARYDRKRELRIDPVVLVYSTYLGGSGTDYGNAIAVDGAGSAYVTGQTASTNFPTESPFQATLQGTQDAFVTKLTPAGNALVYSTYLGGNFEATADAIAVDGAGSAYVTGNTGSSNFPTMSAYQTSLRGFANAFVTKLTPAGELAYSTYLGGNKDDVGYGIAVDAAGSAYLTGATISTDFPLQSPFQATNGNASGVSNAFVAKLTSAGNALVYSTYLGGSGNIPPGGGTVHGDGGYGIAVDAAGSAYVTGYTYSSNFPTQSPYQPENFAAIGDTATEGYGTAFVTKMTPAGNALAYSTYLGGGFEDTGNAIAVDGSGSAYVTGYTYSSNFPTESPYQAENAAAGSKATNAFVTKMTPAGNALVYSTYLGGNGGSLSAGDSGNGIAVDSTGSAYVTGAAGSTNFPTAMPYQATNAAASSGKTNAFVSKLTPAGNALVYSTYLGGSGTDSGNGIAVDAAGSAYVTGLAGSTNFPTASPFQAALQGTEDAFVTKLALSSAVPVLAISPPALTFSYTVGGASPATQAVTVANPGVGTITWSAAASASWLTVSPNSGGGAGTLTIGIDPAGLTAQTYTGTVTVTASGAADSPQTVSVALTVSAASNLPTITSVVNGASFHPGIESGSWVTIQGANLASTTRTWQTSDFNGSSLPLALSGTSVTIDGKAAAVYYISPTQLNVQAPTDSITGAVPVVVTNGGQMSAAFTAQLQTYAPAFFLYSGTSYAIAQRYPDNALVGNPSVVSGTVAAAPGDVLIFWTTGFGPTNPPTPAGIVVSGAPGVMTLPTVTVGGAPVTVISAVLSPGSAGLYQVAIQLPASVATGAVAIEASVGGVQSPGGILIFVSAQ